LSDKDLRINEQIRVREVRLIREDGGPSTSPKGEHTTSPKGEHTTSPKGEVSSAASKAQQQGIISTLEALEIAREQGLDLVEVAPNAVPPVVKIMNYGKFRFENEKKVRDSKKKQKLIKLKEIRMQPKIDDHDLDFKSKHIREFLNDGNKVKVTIRFRGREMAHTELGLDVLNDVLKRIEGEYLMDKAPAMEGRFMSMVLSPKTKK